MQNIIYKSQNDNDTIAVCGFEDSIETEFQKIENLLTEKEKNDILSINNQLFRQQKMAGRLLLHSILGEAGKIEYNEHGKPLLKSHEFDISFSHCKNRVAIMLSKKTAGIDIQDISPKIRRIVHKFINQPELNSLTEDTFETHATVYWCAKETLYKAYGERQLIFTDNIVIEPFSFVKDTGIIKGSIALPKSTTDYVMNYRVSEAFALVYLSNE